MFFCVATRHQHGRRQGWSFRDGPASGARAFGRKRAVQGQLRPPLSAAAGAGKGDRRLLVRAGRAMQARLTACAWLWHPCAGRSDSELSGGCLLRMYGWNAAVWLPAAKSGRLVSRAVRAERMSEGGGSGQACHAQAYASAGTCGFRERARPRAPDGPLVLPGRAWTGKAGENEEPGAVPEAARRP